MCPMGQGLHEGTTLKRKAPWISPWGFKLYFFFVIIVIDFFFLTGFFLVAPVPYEIFLPFL